tara:strand:- start:943 stop:1719 length:777 start_codon:yes stop_codon:yes gene_type:complete
LTSKPLLVFDFDGVIVDGIYEYWLSSKKACCKVLQSKFNDITLPNDIPQAFKFLRPWVEHGWEMVLLAAELTNPNSGLNQKGYKNFADDYQQNCINALNKWKWNPKQLQQALDDVRREAIAHDLETWLASHHSFPGVADRLNELNEEGLEFAVLTTKSAEFTAQLLNSFSINANFLYGYESGSKTEVLLQLSKNHLIQGFIEDRRKTLEKVINTPQLTSIPCFLASWGYLKPNDLNNLPACISLLEPTTFARPLANWN